MVQLAAFLHVPVLCLFLSIVFGHVIGRFHFKGVGFGAVVGTLIAGIGIGIVPGHCGKGNMLKKEMIEKAIELFEGGANESTVVEATGISLDEAKAIAEALYLGETERLLREVALAGVLEAAAQALRRGRGLIGDTAGDVVREIWHSYPNAGLKGGGADRQ